MLLSRSICFSLSLNIYMVYPSLMNLVKESAMRSKFLWYIIWGVHPKSMLAPAPLSGCAPDVKRSCRNSANYRLNSSGSITWSIAEASPSPAKSALSENPSPAMARMRLTV